MRRLPVQLSAEAFADLAAIRAYLLKEAGPAVSSRVVGRIRKKLSALERMPRTGSPRSEFGPNVRLHVSGAYLIYVAVGAARIDVLRILHAARDRDEIMGKHND